MSACESIPFGLPSAIDGPARPDRHWHSRLQEPDETALQYVGPSDFPLMEFWKSAVRRYTKCALTKGADKMIALWGIAKLVRDGLEVEYGLGLWEQNLEDQLTWRVAECTLDERPTDSTAWGIARNFPSWSWASMDGIIEVADRLSQSDKKHWTAKDHIGQALKFDLVGVQRSIEPPPRLASPSSPTQTRGMSDTVVEQQARYRELGKTLSAEKGREGEALINGELDRNIEPKFYSTSLAIAGHVGQGKLQPIAPLRRWRLSIEGLDAELEAFPDIVPKPDTFDYYPHFVVLSAKQVVDSSDANILNSYDAEDDEQDSDDDQSLRERLATKEFFVSGKGILMKGLGSSRFHRTGAFQFERISGADWAKLLEPAKISFWLD